MIDVHNAFPDLVITQDINDNTANSVVEKIDVYRYHFILDYTYQTFNHQFGNPGGDVYEFRTYWNDKAYIRQDWVIARLIG